ncbi:conserved hypothetical protein [Candidatus Brocadia pituitae]|nr:conserved hypothetical protein [Candidatus Brocadia pituitae]
MKVTMHLLGCLFFLFTQSFFISQQVTASEQGYRNYYGMAGNTKPDGDIKYARQMGYEYIAINPSVSPKEYHRNTECAGLKFYLVNPHFYPQVLAGYERDIDITKPVSEAAKEYYNQRMVWRSNDPFPHNLATGYQHAGDAEKISVIWDFQQQAVIDEVVEQIIRLAKSYEGEGLPFTFGGYIMDEPRLEGEFYRLDEKGKNIPVGLSYWTGTDSGLVHDTITHEYATYSDGKVAFYRQLRARLAEEFENPRWIVQPSVLYSEVDTDEWIYQIKDRADKDVLTPDMLSQKHGGHADFVDEEKNFNSGVAITKDAVGISQSGEADEYKNRLFAAKAGIHGAWYNWCGDGMPEFHDISEIHPRLKLIRCLPNWDNLNKVTLPDRAWDGSVYRSTKSYASGDVMYSRHPVTGKLFAVFLTLSGAITLNAGETVTTVQRANSHFIESGDGKNDVSIVGNEIRLKSKDDLGKGYIVTVSTDGGRSGGSQSTVATNSEPDRTSSSEASRGGENNNGLSDMAWVESVSSKKRNKKDIGTKATLAQQAVSSHIWQQVPIRTSAQKAAGFFGGEGFQAVQDIKYAPSNPSVLYMVIDVSGVWKGTDSSGKITWQPAINGFGALGGQSLGIHPTNSNIVFVAGCPMYLSGAGPAGSAQGIYRTSDGASSWTKVKETLYRRDSRSKGANLFAFSGASTVYAGTHGAGLLRSTDGGTTWTTIVSSPSYITDIKIHPKDSTILYMCTTNGLYRVKDSGSITTTRIGLALPSYPYQIAIDKNNPSMLYVTLGSYGVYRSTDGGTTFSARNTGMSSTLTAGYRAYSITISPVDPNYLYVSYDRDSAYSPYGYFYTQNGGANWYAPVNMDVNNYLGSIENYFNMVKGHGYITPTAVHPTNKNVAITLCSGEQPRRTTDGGLNWTWCGDKYTGGSFGGTVGWDKNNPNRYMLFLTDWGPFLTTDGGSTFVKRKAVGSIGWGSTNAGALDHTPGSQIAIAASGDWNNQKLMVTRNLGLTWTEISGTGGVYNLIRFHPTNAQIVYAGRYKFTSIQTNNNYTTLPMPISEMYPGNGDIVYSVTSGGGITKVYKSTNGGYTWTSPYPTIPASGHVGQIAVAPNDENRIYIAMKGTTPYHSAGIWIINNTAVNGGIATLKNSNHGLSKDQFGEMNYYLVSADPNNPNVVYAGQYSAYKGAANGIFRSLDYGNTWSNISGNLSTCFTAHTITVRPNDSYVYVGGSYGTWKLPPPTAVSSVDTIAPQCSISINSDATHTNSTTVTLTLSATDNVGITGYYLSMSSTKPLSSATGWTSVASTFDYTGNVSYTLSSGNGVKTVYAWYKDAAGNVSNTVSDSITLDTTIITSTNVKGLYKFDEGSGTTATDSSGNGKHGTVNGATRTAGKFGGALNFNGTSNYVSIPYLNYDEISVSAWFYRNSVDTANPDTIFGGWSWSNVQGYGLYFDQYGSTKNTIKFIVTSKTSGGTKTQKYAIKDLITSTGKWFHVVGTYNKSTGEQKLYVDGQLVNTQTHPAGNTIVPYSAASYMAIGTLMPNYGHFNGKVDHVEVHSKALSSQEVQNLYTNGSI